MCMNDKKAFIKTFFPDTVEDIQLVYMNLDQNKLTFCDILRNINRYFPSNSKDRNDMRDGKKVVAVICRSDLIEPLNGIVLLISHDVQIRAESKSYVLISIDEEDIATEDSLNDVNEEITVYLAKLIREAVVNFDEFYLRHIYNDYELLRYDEEDEDEFGD